MNIRSFMVIFLIYELSSHFAIDTFCLLCTALFVHRKYPVQQILSAEGQSRLSVVRLQPPVFAHPLQFCHRQACLECQVVG